MTRFCFGFVLRLSLLFFFSYSSPRKGKMKQINKAMNLYTSLDWYPITLVFTNGRINTKGLFSLDSLRKCRSICNVNGADAVNSLTLTHRHSVGAALTMRKHMSKMRTTIVATNFMIFSDTDMGFAIGNVGFRVRVPTVVGKFRLGRI